MKRAVVFGGGRITDYTSLCFTHKDGDYIICADSGIIHCEKLGLKADLWVGDFDSCDFDTCKNLSCAKEAVIERLNPVKDMSDTEYALDYAVQNGYDTLILIGGIGSRLDHSLSNLYLTEKYFKMGIKLTVVDESNVINFVRNSSFLAAKSRFKYVSILPLEDCVVSCSGFCYNLSHEKLFRNSTRAISNELSDDAGTITIHDGSAFIIESID